MAALRQAARKLLLHQRTQAPAAVQRRLIHGGAPNGVDRTAKILEIQEKLRGKKQELYNLLAEAERERHYMNTSRYSMERQRNLRLLQCLSDQIAPWPAGDYMWWHYRTTHIRNGFMICGAAAILLHVGHAAAVRQWDDLKRGREAGTANAVIIVRGCWLCMDELSFESSTCDYTVRPCSRFLTFSRGLRVCLKVQV
jgi:hypothetical protein